MPVPEQPSCAAQYGCTFVRQAMPGRGNKRSRAKPEVAATAEAEAAVADGSGGAAEEIDWFSMNLFGEKTESLVKCGVKR